MKSKFDLIMVVIILLTFLLPACSSNAFWEAEQPAEYTKVEEQQPTKPAEEDSDLQAASISHPAGWSEATHGKESEPNYELVFPQDKVNRIDITISPEFWQEMLNDMTSKYGDFGANRRGPGVGHGELRGQNLPPAVEQPGEGQMVPGESLPQNGEKIPRLNNQPPGGGRLLEGDDNNPIWIPVTLEFNGDTWTNVGLRFKGNSSLFSSWGSGNYKLPLKLDFDEFEDEYPEIDDQRFYGFKQLSLSSNFHDDSLLREKVAADIFREAGVPAAQTAFYQVYIDYGEGLMYFGLYTMVEVIDDTVIKTQFEDDSGNVYKPSGPGATFKAGSFSEDDFDKETNEDEDDFSDIQALFQALSAKNRTSDPVAWRTGLEVVFDVEGFLNWLAVNTVIQNWDTYGSMQHNYYLYHNPTTDLLTWIPWDNNEAFNDGNVRGTVSLSLDEVTDEWPLIRYLMDDPIYQAKYTEYVDALINDIFKPETLIPRYQKLHEMIRPYVVGSEGETEGYTHLQNSEVFEAALNELIQHIQSRYQAVNEYLANLR